MDIFENYFREMRGELPKSAIYESMGVLAAARIMLNYPEHRYRTLRYLAKALYQMKMSGEAYQAALALPPDELGDCADILKVVEYGAPENLNVTLEIITRCNLRCPLCTARADGGYRPNDKQIMPFKTFQKIWNRVSHRAKMAILVGQGETFLHPQIYDILDFLKPVPIHIDTNASLDLDHERIVKSSIETLIFSVDGVDQRTYEQYRVGGHFNKVIENIKATVAAKKKYGQGPAIVFKYIIFRHNEAYAEDALKLAEELGVDKFQTNACNVSPEISRHMAEKFIPVGKNRLSRIDYIDFDQKTVAIVKHFETPYCRMPHTSPYIQIDGTLLPCCAAQLPGFFVEPRNEEERQTAARWREEMSVLTHLFDELWFSPGQREFRLQALKNRYAQAACASCLFPANTFGRLFEGTQLEMAKRQEPSANILKAADLRIEADYAVFLLENNLTKDIEYYKESGVLSPEAEALLAAATSR